MKTSSNATSNAGTLVHIGSIVPMLVQLVPVSKRTVLDAYRKAYVGRRITVKGVLYEIVKVELDKETPGKIMARLVKIVE